MTKRILKHEMSSRREFDKKIATKWGKAKKKLIGFDEASKLTETTKQRVKERRSWKEGFFSVLFRVKALFKCKIARKHTCKQQMDRKGKRES